VAVSLLAGAALAAAALAVVGPAGTVGAARSHGRTAKVHTVDLSTAKVAHVGTVLTTSAGLTLYHFAKDPPGKATCSGACAKIWPPLLAAKGAHVKGPKGVKGLSLVNVGGGHWQVAFDHAALYRFEGDKKKGQAKGQGVAGAWFAAPKSGIPATHAPAAPPATSTTHPATPTTPVTAPPATTTPTVAPPPTTPVTAPPVTAPPVTTPPPPPTTTTTLPPTTTTTSGGGGYGY
jgi:predicted lipoprotein with Yx(FWY)xxD motif